jgi:hypothetical protein
VSQLVFLGLEIPFVVGVRGNANGYPFDDLEAEPFESVDLLGVVGQQPDLADAEVVKNLASDAIVSLVRGMT